MTKKMTVVISPTISLMMDQVENLRSKGLRATFLGSAQRDSSTESNIIDGCFDLVYCTPETFLSASGTLKPLFRSLLVRKKVGLIAVDEAHLVPSSLTPPSRRVIYSVGKRHGLHASSSITSSCTPGKAEERSTVNLAQEWCVSGSHNRMHTIIAVFWVVVIHTLTYGVQRYSDGAVP